SRGPRPHRSGRRVLRRTAGRLDRRPRRPCASPPPPAPPGRSTPSRAAEWGGPPRCDSRPRGVAFGGPDPGPQGAPRRLQAALAPADASSRPSPSPRTAAAGESLIHARGLTKRFGEFTAVDAVDFDVQPGEAFGFLGPNGAGKTSTMRMIGCTSPISDGELSVLGLDPRRDGTRIRARLGVVPQADTLDNELTVRENLIIYGRYFCLPRAAR